MLLHPDFLPDKTLTVFNHVEKLRWVTVLLLDMPESPMTDEIKRCAKVNECNVKKLKNLNKLKIVNVISFIVVGFFIVI